MPLPTVCTLHSRLLSLLFVLCWLYPISAEAKPDATEEHPANMDELQTKAGQGFVKQEMELAADYSVGRGVPKDLSRSAYWYRKAADQGNLQHKFSWDICTPSVSVCLRIGLRQ